MAADDYVVATFTAVSSVQVIQQNVLTGSGNFNALVLRAVGWTPPPYFTLEPASAAQYGGASVSLTGTAAGDFTIASTNITYQWMAGPVGGPYTNLVAGAKYTGVTNTTLTINTLNNNDAVPVYVLAASNGGGTQVSTPATINVIILPAATPGSYEAYALSNNPAGFWPLNETGNPTTGTLLALDYSGNELNGTYGVAALAWTNGIYSPQPPAFGGFATNQGALQVQGSGQVTSVVTLPNLNLQANITNRTIAMWINPNSQPPTSAGLLFTGAARTARPAFVLATSRALMSMAMLRLSWDTIGPITAALITGIRDFTRRSTPGRMWRWWSRSAMPSSIWIIRMPTGFFTSKRPPIMFRN